MTPDSLRKWYEVVRSDPDAWEAFEDGHDKTPLAHADAWAEDRRQLAEVRAELAGVQEALERALTLRDYDYSP